MSDEQNVCRYVICEEDILEGELYCPKHARRMARIAALKRRESK